MKVLIKEINNITMKAFNVLISRSKVFKIETNTTLTLDWKSLIIKDLWASSETEAKNIFLSMIKERFSQQFEVKDENTVITKEKEPIEYKIEITTKEITFEQYFKRTVNLKGRPTGVRSSLFDRYCESFGKEGILLKKDPHNFRAIFYRGEPSDNFKEELKLVFN